MNIITNELSGQNAELLTTEILFFIASAKSNKNEIIRLNIKKILTDEREKKRIEAINRILRSLKRRKVIQFFVISSEITEHTTETEYLKNKYPDIALQSDGLFYILKL